jgi:hypothetical protein
MFISAVDISAGCSFGVAAGLILDGCLPKIEIANLIWQRVSEMISNQSAE